MRSVNRAVMAVMLAGLSVFLLGGGCMMAMELKSDNFKNGKYIPVKHTGQGADVSPQLSWDNVPDRTKSFALICDDPDAPGGEWVHWVVYDIPAFINELDEFAPHNDILDNGIKQGKNDFGKIGYGGPMPPPGRAHRYFFKLYALDDVLGLPAGARKDQLEKAMQGHILAEARIMGLYKR